MTSASLGFFTHGASSAKSRRARSNFDEPIFVTSPPTFAPPALLRKTDGRPIFLAITCWAEVYRYSAATGAFFSRFGFGGSAVTSQHPQSSHVTPTRPSAPHFSQCPVIFVPANLPRTAMP